MEHMKLLTIRSLLLAIPGGLLLCLLALGVRSTESMHPSTWDPDYPHWSSDSVSVDVWGWPLYCAIDHPWQGRVGRLEPLSELVLDRMAGNWLFFILLALYGRGLWALLSRRPIVPQPLPVAALTAPMTVFLVVQALLPWAMLSPWWFSDGTPIGERIVRVALPALLVTLGAYVLMWTVALPVAWLLDWMGWLRPSVVAPLGAAFGVLPLIVMAAQDPTAATTEDAGLFLVGAVAGVLCAGTFWAFSGRRRQRSSPA